MIENGFSVTPASEYRISPRGAYFVRARLGARMFYGQSFAESCQAEMPRLTDSLNVSGIENVPLDGPVIMATNHPTQIDFAFGYQVGEFRPDIKIVAKGSNHLARVPRIGHHFIMLDKATDGITLDDVKKLLRHLRQNGSIAVVPWGTLDHEALSDTSAERAARNMTRLARQSKARVVPCYLDVLWNRPGRLPLRSVHLQFGNALDYTDEEGITATIEDLYDRYAGKIEGHPVISG